MFLIVIVLIHIILKHINCMIYLNKCKYTMTVLIVQHLLSGAETYCGTQSELKDDVGNMGTLYDSCVDKIKSTGWDCIDGLYFENINDDNSVYSHNPEWIVDVAQGFMVKVLIRMRNHFFIFCTCINTFT